MSGSDPFQTPGIARRFAWRAAAGAGARSMLQWTLPSRARALAVLAAVLLAAVPPAGAQQVSLTPHSVFETPEPPAALAFSWAGDRLLAGGASGALTLRSLDDDRTLWRVTPDGGGSLAFVGFLAGDSTAVTLDRGGLIRIHRLADGGEVGRLQAEGAPIQASLDDARRVLAVAVAGHRIELFDLPTRQRVGVIDARGQVEDPLFLGFDRSGRQLLAVGARGRAAAWNPATFEPIRRVTLESSEIHGSRSVVHAAGQDRSANVLVLALEEVALPRGGLRGPARPGDLFRRDQLLVFDWFSGAEIRRVPVSGGAAQVLTVGPGNDHAVVANGTRVTVMDLRQGERGAGIEAPAEVVRLAVSLENDRLAVASADGRVAVWSMAYREPRPADMLEGPQEGLSGRIRVLGESAPAVSPDQPIVLAILPFEDRETDGQMSRTVASLLTTQLANVEHLTLVERMRIDELLAEQDLQRQGITEAGGLELGRMLNADYMLFGSIGASGSSFIFSARIQHVASGEVVSGRQVLCEECRAQDLFDAIHLLGTTIAR